MPRILLVDDNVKNIQLLANLLNTVHYKIEYALNGEAALNWLQKESFDTILLDIMMPGMDGFDTCARIKELPNCKDIPIIFLTARDDTQSITKAFKLGGVDYLTKPFNQEELLARISTHVELKISREKIVDTNKWLESEVKIKTKELLKSNHELEGALAELKNLDIAQNEFLKSISHEIRTPLNGIVGSVGLLKHLSNNPDINEVTSLLEKSVQKLERYSYAALQIAYLRLKGTQQLSLQEVNINAIVKNCVDKFLPLAQEKQLELKINDLSKNIVTKIDHDLISTAISSVIEASFSFTQHGSIELIIEQKSSKFTIKIEDTGSLYSEMKPFYIFDSVNSKGWVYDRNTCMELHLADIIIRTHGGTIEYLNKLEGKGTSTVFTLPLKN